MYIFEIKDTLTTAVKYLYILGGMNTWKDNFTQ